MRATNVRRYRQGYLQPNRQNKSKINVWFSAEVQAAIREVAARSNVRMKDVVAEAFRDVMEKHGVEPPTELSLK